ncbi:hypothetical protein [Paraburkholderia sp.]|uniref:hypothetical protein n=1 Tax=Paraburkholderia sp. TaxID=1926495 RepID=UPI0039E6F69A
MGSLSIWHWLMVVVLIATVEVIPLWMILKKAGYAGAWSLLAFIPVATRRP